MNTQKQKKHFLSSMQVRGGRTQYGGGIAASASILAFGVLLGLSAGCGREEAAHTPVRPTRANQLERQVPPELVLYKELPKIETGFKETHVIGVGPEDSIYVAGDQSLIVFDRTGQLKKQANLPAAATCIGVDATGDIYLGMVDHLEVYDSTLTRKAVWPSFGKGSIIMSVAIGDEVFAGDYGNRFVWRCDKSGRVLGRIGENDKLYFCPCIGGVDLALAPDGSIWICDHKNFRVVQYGKDGNSQMKWGERSDKLDGFNGACNPTHIAIGGDGQIFTSEKDIERIKVSNTNGTLIGVVAPPSSFPTKTVGIDLAIDSDGRVLALDPVQKAVRVFVRNDAQTETAGGK